jgi:hypothetical protein
MIINFEMTDGLNTLRDAIVLADGISMTDAEIEKIKQSRFAAWLDVINTLPIETVEE